MAPPIPPRWRTPPIREHGNAEAARARGGGRLCRSSSSNTAAAAAAAAQVRGRPSADTTRLATPDTEIPYPHFTQRSDTAPCDDSCLLTCYRETAIYRLRLTMERDEPTVWGLLEGHRVASADRSGWVGMCTFVTAHACVLGSGECGRVRRGRAEQQAKREAQWQDHKDPARSGVPQAVALAG